MCHCVADLLLLCIVHPDTVAAMEQHIHVLCGMVPDWLRQLPAPGSVLCVRVDKYGLMKSIQVLSECAAAET